MGIMRGERGEWIRQAADAEKREENIVMMKVLYAIIWLVQLMAILTDTVLSFFSKDYKVGIFERTKPAIFKDNYESDGTLVKGKTIRELQSSKLLKDRKLWD